MPDPLSIAMRDTPAARNAGVRPWLRPLFYFAGLALLAWMAWISRAQLAELSARLEIAWFLASLPLGLLMTLCYGGLFGLILRKHGASIGVPDATLVFLESQPGKYVPGRIGSIAMQALLIQSRNPWMVTTLANIELLSICLLHMILIGAAALLYKSATAITLLCAGFAAGIALVRYHWLEWLVALLRPAADDVGGSHDALTAPPIAQNAAMQALALVFAAASTCVLLKSSGMVADADIATVAGVLYLGWAVGTLALPVPAGFGVREAATLLIGNFFAMPISSEQLVALALLSRAWQLCVDMACLLLAATMRGLRRPSS